MAVFQEGCLCIIFFHSTPRPALRTETAGRNAGIHHKPTRYKIREEHNITSFAWGTNKSGGHAVAQLVEALRYKSEGRGFDSRWCHWYFLLTYSFQPYYGPGVDSASKRNEYQEYFLGGKESRCVGLITLPPSCADCLEIWDPQLPGTLRACPGL